MPKFMHRSVPRGFIHGFDKPQNTSKCRLFQKMLALNMIKSSAQWWLSKSRLPRGLRFGNPPHFFCMCIRGLRRQYNMDVEQATNKELQAEFRNFSLFYAYPAVFGKELCAVLKYYNFSKIYVVFSGHVSLTLIAELLQNAYVLLQRFLKPRLWWEQHLPN